MTPHNDVLVVELAVSGRGACIRACLWQPDTNTLVVLREWAARHSLLLHADLKGIDATLWNLSGMEP